MRRSATSPERPIVRVTTVLGVDPGTLVTGFGVVSREGATIRLLEAGAIANSPRSTLPERLLAIHKQLRKVLVRYHPDEFAVENAFYGKNAQSALKLGHARGVCLLAAIQSGLTAAEYSPREVKKAVAGNGNASKEQVQFMVKALLGLKSRNMPTDTSDAIAVALCHLNRTFLTPVRHHDWRAYVQAHPEKVVP